MMRLKELKRRLVRILQALLRSTPMERIYERFLMDQIAGGTIPGHIGIILDGNRRWAKERGLKPWRGHQEGADKIEQFLNWCLEIDGVQSTTLYVFSMENFQRSEREVEEIFKLVHSYLDRLLKDPKTHSNRMRVTTIGQTDNLPEDIRDLIGRIEDATRDYDNLFLNIAIAYGGRTEIVDAMKRIITKVSSGELKPEEVDEQTIESHLYTKYLAQPNPDMIIRTSGESRLSNFLLWQSAYSELFFFEVFWPAFRKIDLLRAIRLYQQRQRRYGA